MSFIGLILLLYVGFGAILFITQRNFIYFPTDKLQHSETGVVFKNDGAKIQGILLNPGNRDALIYFGGNAEEVAFNAADFKKEFPDHSIYLINYRGYGGSTGKPNEKGLYSDALFIFDQISSSSDRISIVGRSLGSGVASYVASKRNVEKLVLVTPFDSIERIAQKSFPIYPMSLLLKDKFNSSGRAGDIKADVLVLIAENDEVIPRHNTDNLIDSFVDNSVVVEVITGAGHNDISLNTKYYRLIKMFIRGS